MKTSRGGIFFCLFNSFVLLSVTTSVNATVIIKSLFSSICAALVDDTFVSWMRIHRGKAMITKLVIVNFKMVKKQTYSFTNFDLLVGWNNSGKSTIL